MIASKKHNYPMFCAIYLSVIRSVCNFKIKACSYSTACFSKSLKNRKIADGEAGQ